MISAEGTSRRSFIKVGGGSLTRASGDLIGGSLDRRLRRRRLSPPFILLPCPFHQHLILADGRHLLVRRLLRASTFALLASSPMGSLDARGIHRWVARRLP